MKNTAQSPIKPDTTDELIITLENDAVFHQAYCQTGHEVITGFFNTYNELDAKQVQYSFPVLDQEKFSDCYLNVITRPLNKELSEAMTRLSLCMPDDCEEPRLAVLGYFGCKLATEIQSGEFTYPQETLRALSVIYRPGTSVAGACRELGMNRYAVNQLRTQITESTYRRYLAVQQGHLYGVVMGDCAGFIHNHPQFTPVIQERECENNLVEIEAGDLVAPWGDTERWFVAARNSGKSSVSTTMPSCAPFEQQYITRPCRVLKKQYASQVGRFGGQVNGVPARQFLLSQSI